MTVQDAVSVIDTSTTGDASHIDIFDAEDGAICQTWSSNHVCFLCCLPGVSNWNLYAYRQDTMKLFKQTTPDTYWSSANNPNRDGVKLITDNKNNLFIIGLNTDHAIYCQAYAYTSGSAWTKKAQLFTVGVAAANIQALTATWVNLGGTNGNGQIMVIYVDVNGKYGYAALDAGAALAGSGTLLKAHLTGGATTFLGSNNTGNTTGTNLDISSTTFGAATGLCSALKNLPSTVMTGRWGIDANGSLTINSYIGDDDIGAILGVNTKLRLLRTNETVEQHVLICPSPAGQYRAYQFSGTAKVTDATDSGAIPGMGYPGVAPRCWDAFADPGTANKVWAIAMSAITAANDAPVMRLAVNLTDVADGGGIRWATTPVSEPRVDPAYAVTGSGRHIRSVKRVPNPAAGIRPITWQAFARTATSGTGIWRLSEWSRQYLIAPSAPTPVYPISNQHIDTTIINRFLWTFNDVSTNTQQGAYTLEWRLSGAGTWHTIQANSSNQYWDAPANTFPASSTIEWRVSTADQNGNLGPYCASQFADTVGMPATPVITTPTASSTVVTNPASVIWTTAFQDAYQVVVAKDSGLLNIDYDSGTVEDPANTGAAVPFPENGENVYISVRIRYQGYWSAWAAPILVHVSYIPIAAPVIQVTPYPAQGFNRISWVNASGTERNYVWRQPDGADDDNWTLIAIDQRVDSSFDDYGASGGSQVWDYKVTAFGTNVTQADSDIAGTQLALAGTWLHDPRDPASTAARFQWDGMGRSVTETREVALQAYAGRELPVAEFGTSKTTTLTMSLALEIDSGDAAAMQALVSLKTVLLYRDGRGRKYYVMISDLPFEDHHWGTMISLTANVVDYLEGIPLPKLIVPPIQPPPPPPTPPTITGPGTSTTITANPSNVTWAAANQDAYELIVSSDIARATVLYDSGTVESGSKTASVPFPTSGIDVYVSVRIRYSAVWSLWSTPIFLHVSYGTTPLALRLGVSVHDQTSYNAKITPAEYGPLPAIRVYQDNSGVDGNTWSGYCGANKLKGATIISWKFPATEVIAGTHDTALTNFFKNAPTGFPIYWCYWHEPEDDILSGTMTIANYRAAWQHIYNLSVGITPLNPDLHPTLILMGYSLTTAGINQRGHTWKDYVSPNSDPTNTFIQYFGWDCYPSNGVGIPDPNLVPPPSTYVPPSLVVTAMKGGGAGGADLKWGFAEFGTCGVVVNKADGSVSFDISGRGAWTQKVAKFAHDKGASFCMLFDSTAVGGLGKVRGNNGLDYQGSFLITSADPNTWRLWQASIATYSA